MTLAVFGQGGSNSDNPIGLSLVGTYATDALDEGSSAISLMDGNGIEASVGSMKMNVYPNPSNVGFINLTLSNAEGVATEGLVEMRDITGRSLTQRQVAVGANQTLRLETSDIPAGIYTVSYTSGSERVTQRFIIE